MKKLFTVCLSVLLRACFRYLLFSFVCCLCYSHCFCCCCCCSKSNVLSSLVPSSLESVNMHFSSAYTSDKSYFTHRYPIADHNRQVPCGKTVHKQNGPEWKRMVSSSIVSDSIIWNQPVVGFAYTRNPESGIRKQNTRRTPNGSKVSWLGLRNWVNQVPFKVLLRRKFLFSFPSFFNINLFYMFKIIQTAKNWNDTCVRGLEISHWKVRKYRPPLQSSQSNSPRDLRKAVLRLTTWFMHCDVETSTKRFAFGKSLWV